MLLSLPKAKLSRYLQDQLARAFPDGQGPSAKLVSRVVAEALEAAEYCFTRIDTKYFLRDGHATFNHLNSDQYAMFLYWVSRFAFKRGEQILADKAYYLNKMMHGLEVLYAAKLPKVFYLSHPIGAILGRAQYSDGLVIHQGVTVGGNHLGIYPSLGKYVTLLPGCVVIGESHIGSNTIIAPHTVIKDQNVGNNRIAFPGQSGFVERRNNNQRYRALFR